MTVFRRSESPSTTRPHRKLIHEIARREQTHVKSNLKSGTGESRKRHVEDEPPPCRQRYSDHKSPHSFNKNRLIPQQPRTTPSWHVPCLHPARRTVYSCV